MILFFKIFAFAWVVFRLQKELRQMKYELSVVWFNDQAERVLNCWFCFSFWSSLATIKLQLAHFDIHLTTFDTLLTASSISFATFIAELVINKIQTFKI